MGIFSKKSGSVTHNYICGPLTPYEVSENTNEPILRKLTDLRTDGRTDGRTDALLQDPSGRGRGSKKQNFESVYKNQYF